MLLTLDDGKVIIDPRSIRAIVTARSETMTFLHLTIAGALGSVSVHYRDHAAAMADKLRAVEAWEQAQKAVHHADVEEDLFG